MYQIQKNILMRQLKFNHFEFHLEAMRKFRNSLQAGHGIGYWLAAVLELLGQGIVVDGGLGEAAPELGGGVALAEREIEHDEGNESQHNDCRLHLHLKLVPRMQQ
jgi:hypothetical protein